VRKLANRQTKEGKERGTREMNWSMQKTISAFVVLWLVLPPFYTHSEVSYSWPKQTVEKCIKNTSVFFVNYPQGTILGGGVIISKKGRILTAAHLFTHGKNSKVQLVTWNGETYDAKVLSINARLDLALVEPMISAQEFPFAKIQKSDDIYVGQDILVVGHPYDQYWTVTAGIIARLPWLLWYCARVIETDALINPGNSGGPAFNTKGEIIGIVSARYPLSGIGIIVPIKEIHFFLRAYEGQKKPDTQIKRYRIGDTK
jgi:S1-C subfamily serine protease